MIEKHVAGDTLDFNVSVPAYPASAGWTLKYSLTPRFTTPTQAVITLTAASNADGISYDVQSTPATTAAWAAGFYTWARWVEKSGARQTLDESGQIQIKADPATQVAGYDSRSHPRKMLDAIEASLEGRASSSQIELISYTIGSRSQSRDPKVLSELRSKYRREVSSEAATALGLQTGPLGRVRYGVPQ